MSVLKRISFDNFQRLSTVTIQAREGIETQYPCNILIDVVAKKCLSPAKKSTYFMGTVEDGWRAVFAMTELFSAVAPGVAEKLGYEYSFEEEQSCMEFLEHVRNMPEDADEF